LRAISPRKRIDATAALAHLARPGDRHASWSYPGMDTFEWQRRLMVENQLIARGIHDVRLLEVMSDLPRECFVPPYLAAQAYEDRALPIPEAQTISQPCMVAKMIEAARVGRTDRVLDVGTGSGYGAAVLSRLARTVYSIERHAALSAHAAATLAALGLHNVSCVVGDGTLGYQRGAPFDVIIASAAARRAPPRLLEQLAIGGRLVMPIGAETEQTLMTFLRLGPNRFTLHRVASVRCAPMVHGEPHGFTALRSA
jgi:protein-L-isoaspartate(D-aspartate) O-methyltransferase